MEGLDKTELDQWGVLNLPEITPLQLPSQTTQKYPRKPPIPLPPHTYERNKEVVPSEFKVTQTIPSDLPEPKVDAKRMKRILQNREYSNKHRLKQMEHIRDLEKKVESLRATILEISAIRIEESANKNTLLKAENVQLKDKISVMSGELAFKEAQAIELNKEKDRLVTVVNNWLRLPEDSPLAVRMTSNQ
ncbi:hypothetical protein TIFTF001_000199 [Ficus carica]|uniref:BZIP domain-containing protein n=1 Tax=Ficus carica TaxID=3494 RepID=A0AA87YUV6_FICCA|nr:hypothetical protein TIFTF001_000199 [Ficus carica]